MILSNEELKQLKKKYFVHKSNRKKLIKKQGLTTQYLLTFDDFVDIWVTSGMLHNMGRRRGGSVMMRIDHQGDYEYNNMLIATLGDSTIAAHKGTQKHRGLPINTGIKRSAQTKALMSANRKGKPKPPTMRPIQTPMGLFKCIQEAADHYGIRPEGIHYFKRKYPNEYYYI